MRERKKTGVHGTLEMIPLAWKFNSKQLLCKTLNSSMNIIETRAVLNIVKTDGKSALRRANGRAENYLEGFVLSDIQFSPTLYTKNGTSRGFKNKSKETFAKEIFL